MEEDLGFNWMEYGMQHQNDYFTLTTFHSEEVSGKQPCNWFSQRRTNKGCKYSWDDIVEVAKGTFPNSTRYILVDKPYILFIKKKTEKILPVIAGLSMIVMHVTNYFAVSHDQGR